MPPPLFPEWLTDWMRSQEIVLWGAADLRGFATPADASGEPFPRAVSWAIPMDPRIMAGIQAGPNDAYADEYERVNRRIDALGNSLTSLFETHGAKALPLAASERTDPARIRGDFPQKTAATRAGLGFVGLNCQLVTRRFGPWVRLGTVFVDADLPCGPTLEHSRCGGCRRCVEACPAKALTGTTWRAGIEREAMLDAAACDRWKKEHYFQYHHGHNCGICAAVCPYGLDTLKRRP